MEHEVDVLIYGTGFTASKFLSGLKVTGRGGRELHDAWAGDARAYLGMTTPGFPNFFMIYGPNTNIVVNGSIIFFSECSVRYIVGALRLLAETGAKAIEVKRGRPRRLQHPRRRGQQGLGLGLGRRLQLVQERVRPGQPELAVRPDRLLARHAGAQPGRFRADQTARARGLEGRDHADSRDIEYHADGARLVGYLAVDDSRPASGPACWSRRKAAAWST